MLILKRFLSLWLPLDNIVAEKISYFCLACNLIRPLGLTHNFTQSGWLILFSPDHLSGQHKLGKSAKHSPFTEQLRSGQTSYCLLFNSSSSIKPTWWKPSNLWAPCVYSLRPRVPSCIWIRWIQYTTHRNNFTSPPKLAMSTAMQNSAPAPSYFISGQHSHFSLKQLEPQTHGDYNHFCPQTANMTFATQWRTYLPQHIQQCLNLTMHFSLGHLAAKMLSQIYNNFILFPCIFPSSETCSINVNPLFHAAIKKLHIKPYSLFFLLLHHPPLYT